ncbi:hypothetical protein FBEOM_11863, partial [Fusarium beomiforme]
MLPQPTQIAKQHSGQDKSHKRDTPPAMLQAWFMQPPHAEVWSSERAKSQTNGTKGG